MRRASDRRRSRRHRRSAAPLSIVVATVLLAGACAGGTQGAASHPTTTGPRAGPTSVPGAGTSPLEGMPAPLDPHDVYAADRPGRLSPAVAKFPPLVYVPNSKSNTVDVVDPSTGAVVRRFPVGALPQHVVPSYDLETLWVTNDLGNSLTPVDPRTGTPGPPVAVDDPYNLYFTPDGRYAVVVAERLRRLDFRDAHTMALVRSLPVGCKGVDHLDFSADGTYLLASCEFDGRILKVDVARQQVVATLELAKGARPQDVKLAPDGSLFYVADMSRGGVYEVDGGGLRTVGFIPTGRDAHGLYVSRDSRRLYVSNRRGGSVSVVDFATRRVVATWPIPGGTPDMGGVSADGTTLWLAGRYSGEVYAIDTGDGHLLKRIKVGAEPHGLCVYPQPGRYSLGHTGVFR